MTSLEGRQGQTRTGTGPQAWTPVQFLKGVGPVLGEKLARRGIFTAADLLSWYPRGYEDRRAGRTVSTLTPGETVSLEAAVVRVREMFLGKSKRKMWDVVVQDATGSIVCKFFRQPFKGFFERLNAGKKVRVVGKTVEYRGRTEFHHPDIQVDGGGEPIDDAVVPIYPEMEGITNRQWLKILEQAMVAVQHSIIADAKYRAQFEIYPEWLRNEFSLPSRLEALKQVHFPPKDSTRLMAELKTDSHRRLIFEEFFELEVLLASRRQGVRRESGPALKSSGKLVGDFLRQLPFPLTGAQERVFQTIVKDLAEPHPMHRLVQGDVGCGKTVVALMAALVAIDAGFQAALMAPTELLAEQHYRNAKKFLEPLGITVGLFNGSQRSSERQQGEALLSAGAIHLAVGTHALIQDSVVFRSLGLAVVDEQHRFGVEQRNRLKQKGWSPHLLLMTATPIPRTLALTVYGDLDVSIINELPKGRIPIVTKVAWQSQRAKVLAFMESQLKEGRQAYLVCPLIEESEKVDLINALEEFERIKSELPHRRAALLHGRMKADEKDQVMREFRDHKFDILVATTVIEVGVDVPNASFIWIQHSERFGLSQLHQLRGRVGRGTEKSYCVLMCGHAVGEDSRARLGVMEQTTDGLVIAEKDLEIRGPGEFLGTKQSGLPGFRLASLVRDGAILDEARRAAHEIFLRDPDLKRMEHSEIRSLLARVSPRTIA